MSVPVPLDEYPIHQAPVSMRYFGGSERNVYDRCIMQCSDRTGATQLIFGLGVYPALGVIDGYAVVRQGQRQHVVRTSGALGDDRMTQRVGPLHIEVVEPLRRLRAVCDGDEHGVGFDLTWTGSVPAQEEPRHVYQVGDRVILDACRFMQTGLWSGTLRVNGTEIAVTDADWVGSRDRSWGVRPVGEAEPPGRPRTDVMSHWWCWVPLRFDDYSLMVIAQDHADGTRLMYEAVRLFPEDSGRAPEHLGFPEFDIRYRPGTRHPEHATIHLGSRRSPLTVEVDTLGGIPLSVGCGYGGDPDWTHGQWRGESWVEGATYDLDDPAIAARLPFAHVDHVARATCEGMTGYGIFEHASIGRHDPTGFTDFEMAP